MSEAILKVKTSIPPPGLDTLERANNKYWRKT